MGANPAPDGSARSLFGSEVKAGREGSNPEGGLKHKAELEIRFDGEFTADLPEGMQVFAQPRRIIDIHGPEDLAAGFAAMDQALREGFWIAGYACYELGYLLEPRLTPLLPSSNPLPLLRFGVFDAPQPAKPHIPQPAALTGFKPRPNLATYRQAFERLHRRIGAGDLYQANLTFPIDAVLQGDPADVYHALRASHPVRYPALIRQGPALPAIASLSPELFFQTDAAGRIETRPMKGTAPRGRTPQEDQTHRDWLYHDEKNRAENIMIVDLLRNDISRISRPGSVWVPALFQIEDYPSVFQMTSTVAADLHPGARLSDILRALFPCGSITGAPKIRAMQILRALEPEPRGIYCGAIGWAAPDGRSCFNVAIRTLSLSGGKARLNVGGGIVWDSRADAEYEEALWKSRFAR